MKVRKRDIKYIVQTVDDVLEILESMAHIQARAVDGVESRLCEIERKLNRLESEVFGDHDYR